MNPSQIVADGYDQIADRYVEWSDPLGTEQRDRYLTVLLQWLPVGATMLELGCGTGPLTTCARRSNQVCEGAWCG